MSDPFELLGVEPGYALDLGAIERRHRELSRALHPDRHAGSPPAERRQSLGRAIEVNDAWRTLRDPVRRAEALLRRVGVSVEEGQQNPTDPALLMDLMELREGLSEARDGRDDRALTQLMDQVRQRQVELERQMATSLAAALAGSAPPAGEAREALLGQLAELRYYRKFLDDAAVIEDELF